VWFSPTRGADDLADGSDYYVEFATFAEAQAASHGRPGADEPLALVLQREHIEETQPGHYRHVRHQRVT
jgi:hypothetical protein